MLGRALDSLPNGICIWVPFPKVCNHLACSYIFLISSFTRPLLLIYVQNFVDDCTNSPLFG